jgi:hypothetical protein
VGRRNTPGGADCTRRSLVGIDRAVASLGFVEAIKNDLGLKGAHRDVIEADGSYDLREPTEAYAGNFTGKNEGLMAQNTILWDESVDEART